MSVPLMWIEVEGGAGVRAIDYDEARELGVNLADRWHLSDRIGHVLVSTVFLGIEHGREAEGAGAPILYETMAFAQDNAPGHVPEHLGRELLQERYATRARAKAGHERLVAALRRLAEEVPELDARLRLGCPIALERFERALLEITEGST